MFATVKQNCGVDSSLVLIVVSFTTENNRTIHIRKAVAHISVANILQSPVSYKHNTFNLEQWLLVKHI